jgi:ribosomal protein L11 methyltransferase
VSLAAFLELSFDLGSLDADRAESAAVACGAFAVTFLDARDEGGAGSPVLEPAPGEMALWPATRARCLFGPVRAPEAAAALAAALAAMLGIEAATIEVRTVEDRAWEREWLKDFHAMRFGRRLWVCPHHERVNATDAVVIALDPGLAFGTGSHASTALCLTWLDAHMPGPTEAAEHFVQSQAHGLDAHMPGPTAAAEHFVQSQAHGLDAHMPLGARVIDYGCGSGMLGIAAARLGAAEVHAFDTDPQALTATLENARANEVQARLQVHASAATLPAGADVLLANILAAPLCALAPCFAALVREGGYAVLAGLMEHEVEEVTAAYAACFDVAGCGERDGWACLAGRRR